MTFRVKPRVLETSTITGTGTYTLAGAPTGYQAFLGDGIVAGDVVPAYVTDGISWEEGFYTVGSGPATLARTSIQKSSTGGAAINWAASTVVECHLGWVSQLTAPRRKSVSIAGGAGTQVLTEDEQRCDELELTGAITGNRVIEVSNTPWNWASVYNNTTGAFTVTLKVNGQTGVVLTQGRRASLHNDGTDVRLSSTGDIANRNINGGALSNNVGDATNDIDIAAVDCMDSTGAFRIQVGAATKQLDANWAAGTAGGMRNSAAAIANGTYHIYAVSTAAGVGGIYAYAGVAGTDPDTAASVATVLTALRAEAGGSAYVYARRIGSILREAAAIIGFVQNGDFFQRKTPVQDIAANAPGVASVTRTLSVPLGIKVIARTFLGLYTTSAGIQTYGCLTDLAINDLTLDQVGGVQNAAAGTYNAAGMVDVTTNNSAQIRSRVSGLGDANVTINVITYAWFDSRGRNA